MNLPLKFRLNKLHMVEKKQVFFEICRCISIGDEESYDNENIISELQLLVNNKENNKIYVGGSSIFGIGSDLDLIILGKHNKYDFFDDLLVKMKMCGFFTQCKLIKNEHLSYLKATNISNVNLDIHYLQTEQKTIMSIEAKNLGESERETYNTYAESNYIRILLIKINKFDIFKKCLYIVKQKFKESNIYGSEWGYFAGISISIMTAKLFLHVNNINDNNNNEINENNVIDIFCDYYKNYDYVVPINLTNNHNAYDDPSSKMIIIETSMEPKIQLEQLQNQLLHTL